MSSVACYVKEEILPKIIGFLLFAAACACFIGFAIIIPYIQKLPLFRLDTTDACWFSICCAIYFIPFCIAGSIVLACIAAVVGSIVGISVFFYKHVILKPGRAILCIFIGLVLLWIGTLGYGAYLELAEFLS